MPKYIIIITGILLFFTHSVRAEKISFSIGSRQQSADVGELGDSAQGTSFQVGLERALLSEEGVSLVSGASYVRRLITIKNYYPARYSTYEGNYIDIPIRAKVIITKKFDVWGGISLATLLSSQCKSDARDKSCDVKEQKRFLVPFSVGLNYNFATQFGLGVFYEMTSDQLPPNKISSEIGSYRTAGMNLLYYF